jgi:hypothetical protein
MITRLAGVLVCVLMSAHVVHAEADFDFRKLDGRFRVDGKSEVTNFSRESGTFSQKVERRTIPLEFVLKNSTRNSFTIVWFPADVPHVVANTIRWEGSPDSPAGDLQVGGAFHVRRGSGLIAGFYGKSRMRRTEDDEGVIIEEENFRVGRDFDWKRVDMPRFRMVVRPNKIVIHLTVDVFHGDAGARQKLTAEIDY